MTLLGDAAVLTTANAYKAGVLYSIKPDSGAADLDITRASTATTVSPLGIIEPVDVNVPQIDYTDGCGSFWIEAQATNLVLYSGGINNAVWSKSDVTVVADYSVPSPEANVYPFSYEMTTSSNFAQMYQTITVVAGTSYTYSFYAHKGTMTDMKYKIFDMDNGADLVASTSYYSSLGSGWTRISKVFTTGAGNTTIRLYALETSSNTGTMYLWGMQLEENTSRKNMESSYIPTTLATVTRNASTFVKTGLTSTMGSTEGVLFVEMAMFYNGVGSPSSNQKMMGWKSSSGRALLGTWGSSWFAWTSGSGGNTIFSMTPGVANGNFVKMALKYKAGDHAYWKDGVVQATGTDATAITADQDILVCSYENIPGFWEFYGKIRTIQVYKTALTDPQLTDLTTP